MTSADLDRFDFIDNDFTEAVIAVAKEPPDPALESCSGGSSTLPESTIGSQVVLGGRK